MFKSRTNRTPTYGISSLHDLTIQHHSGPGIKYSLLIAAAGLGMLGEADAGHAQAIVTVLHPAGSIESHAGGVWGSQQVGSVSIIGDEHFEASLWTGSAGSWASLHPAGAIDSSASATSGNQQVGWATIGGVTHASLWGGTAASWVSLQPVGVPGLTASMATALHAGQQVGSAEVNNQLHASLWNGTSESWVDLHPSGSDSSTATSVWSGQQGGYAGVHACLWSGTAESIVDLHPAASGANASVVFEIHNGQQVGFAGFAGTRRACLWHGTADSWQDLQPWQGSSSEARGVFDGWQIGHVRAIGTVRASLWHGTADSWVDLHVFLPSNFVASYATSVWADAKYVYIAGSGLDGFTDRLHAMYWKYSRCAADYDVDGAASVPDIFIFLTLWFAGDVRANFDGFGSPPEVEDIFAFLNAWFAGCP